MSTSDFYVAEFQASLSPSILVARRALFLNGYCHPSIWLRKPLTDCGFYMSGVIVASMDQVVNPRGALHAIAAGRQL